VGVPYPYGCRSGEGCNKNLAVGGGARGHQNVTARLCIGSATSDERLQRRSMYRVSAQRTVSVVSALATLTLLAGLVQQSSSTTAPNKLLLLLIDGFRWDYFDKFSSDQLPGFTRLRQNSVAVEAFVPAFPSLSFVNYYSIMTGNLIFCYFLCSRSI